jgi:hypothetical protein
VAEFTHRERRDLEIALGMESGYVLHFSNCTFSEFVFDTVGIDIDEHQYYENGTSKANRLRTFWAIELDHVVGNLLRELLTLAQQMAARSPFDPRKPELFERCFAIAGRLSARGAAANADSLRPLSAGEQDALLARQLQAVIASGEFEAGIDRLRTYCMRYFRNLCAKREVTYTTDETLNAIFGKYIRLLENNGLIESELTRHILKSSITTFARLNTVRNEMSFAHDNKLLNRREAQTIFDNVLTTIRFIQDLEG